MSSLCLVRHSSHTDNLIHIDPWPSRTSGTRYLCRGDVIINDNNAPDANPSVLSFVSILLNRITHPEDLPLLACHPSLRCLLASYSRFKLDPALWTFWMCISLWFFMVSTRLKWRARRRARLVRERSRSDERPGPGHDTKKNPVRDIQQSDERPHQANLSSIPEGSRSRIREPPVIIGDPLDTRRSSRTSIRQIEAPTPRSSRASTRRSFYSPDDIPNRNSFDFRIIPVIPQEDAEDILSTPSPRRLHSQSRSPSQSPAQSHALIPTHPPVHTIFQP